MEHIEGKRRQLHDLDVQHLAARDLADSGRVAFDAQVRAKRSRKRGRWLRCVLPPPLPVAD